MERHRQTLGEIVATLGPVKTTWRDARADAVIRNLGRFPDKAGSFSDLLSSLLREDFDAGLTTIRLILDFSEDEFRGALREAVGARALG